MAIAGKVAITPGYEWSVDVAYDKLVVVTFGNNVYLSIKPSTGIEPTNEEYWMLLIENVTAEDLAELQTIVENIINGTTTVGNADTVDGYHASDFLHAGNKPTGTYTGNGSAESRTIATGGIGYAVLIFSSNGFSILTPSGAIARKGEIIETSNNSFLNGVITLNTDDINYNATGVTYYYQVL